ncbi:unnamed protein product [Protopolystoma xenopodis]|uniref:Tubulin--tyrosine ligase-like protein 9 n=1 Tax=Protopolystoma xenopodis TaxID=117903 RepID=A0A448XI61_9PLAT|nr:unnamed protein product [Protopolystoma xenopodis]
MDVMRNRGWQEVLNEVENCDIYWCDREWIKDKFDKKYLPDNMRINHFRNYFEVVIFIFFYLVKTF